MMNRLKSKKGFTLVELVIVIAIIGVLAALALSMFTGIIGQAKTTTDEAMASKIQSAVLVYVTQTGDSALKGLGTLPALVDGNAQTTVVLNPAAVAPTSTDGIVRALQIQYTYNGKVYGPFLDGKNGKIDSISWKPQTIGTLGFNIIANKTLGNVSVTTSAALGKVTVN